MEKSILQTDFIWTPQWTATDDTEARIVYFRKVFHADDQQTKHVIFISADSRYKLYVNGAFIQEGPQKAIDLTTWFVDSANIAPWLKAGLNAVAVEVLRYPAASMGKLKFNASLLRSETPMLYVHDTDAANDDCSAKCGWKCLINRNIEMTGENFLAGPVPIYAQENVTATEQFAFWKSAAYDDSSWDDCSVRMITDTIFAGAPFKLTPRTIPKMKHEIQRFESVSMIRQGGDVSAAYEKMIHGETPVTVPPHTVQIVEIAAGAENCGNLLFTLCSGKKAQITITCAECYSYPQPDVLSPLGSKVHQVPMKKDRTDKVNGTLSGCSSYYTTAGYGTADMPEVYEPFWFSTFRYIQLRIETAEEPLTVLDFSYRTTLYPLNVRTEFEIDCKQIKDIWDISVRTLRLCMHETYMDCPFYEQMQYAMDSRSEMLFTYAISADDRLARQAIEAFRHSQRPDGLMNADAPSRYAGVIPGFSIYYILMVYDHMMYFGDKTLVKDNLPAIDQILAFFDRNLSDDGLVKKIGDGLLPGPFWSFIDWAEKWPGGVPNASHEGTGNLTMESLLYLYGLQKATELAEFAGRSSTAEEYEKRSSVLAKALQSHCIGTVIDKNGSRHQLIQDGSGVNRYSVHCQAFAVLTSLVGKNTGRDMLDFTVGNPSCAQPSVAFMFYVFRAYEGCGMYERTSELWDPWRNMLKNRLTTCTENETDERSDCHAWGALMCYELSASIFGVRPAAPGFSKITIHPLSAVHGKAEGSIVTPKGMVRVMLKDGQLQDCLDRRV